jgi:DnaJ-class molecular chaperone
MESNDPQEKPRFPFAGEYLKRYEANFGRMQEVKAWRTREFDAGKPSALKDYFRAHGFCSHCHGVGLAMNEDGMGYKAVGWDGDMQLFEECGFCGGSGTLPEQPSTSGPISNPS